MKMRALTFALVLLAGAAQAQQEAPDLFAEALRYHAGDGVLQDYAQAATYLRSAAEMGHAPAQNMLGRYLFEGLGVPQDRVAALRWLQAAAATQDPAFLFDAAQVLEADPDTLPQAVAYYAQAARLGFTEAAVSLGTLHQEGRGVAQDYARARALYEGPAAGGNAKALNNLGLLYVRAHGVEQDYARAANLFAQAAELGLAEAMTNLGVLYENGFGVPLDETRAAELYRAAGGSAARAVSYVYDPRFVQVTADQRGSLLDSAQVGDPVAQFQWSWLILSDPQSGFDARTRAARMLRRTASQGHGPSMLNLGLLYMSGVGVPQDYVLGHAWLLLAQARGVVGAADAVAYTAPRLTAAQVNEAQRRAKEYTPDGNR